MKVQVLIVIVNFKHDGCAFELERAKVMFPVWIVGSAEIVKGCDNLDQTLDGLLA